MVPLFGYRPKILAGAVDVISTKRFIEIRPWRTPPSHIRYIRVSTPGMPFGIFAKLPVPRSFCPFMQNGQWSVETTCRSFVRRPRHMSSCMWAGRSGGVQTNFAPSKSGRARSSWERKRYCGHVSAKTGSPRSRASTTCLSARSAERWTMYTGAPAISARQMARNVPSASAIWGRVRPW